MSSSFSKEIQLLLDDWDKTVDARLLIVTDALPVEAFGN